ncbi:hypothetical protein [Helicobacter pylori]|uniref:hypothetical protein n=1 Tax=Helicobacter pylori TaxID=210 RepID=UPI0034674D25
MGRFFRKSSNDTQENSKDAQKKEEALKKVQEENTKLKEANTELNRERTDLAREKDKLVSQNTELTEKNKVLITEKENLNNQLNASQKQVKALEQSQQALKNEKAELLREKENLTKANTELKTEKDKLEQKHAPYQKLEKLYEVFLEVKDRLNFGFVEKTHSAMDLIAHVLSDSKYYLESLYNKASQELSDKRSDKSEKLAELFDLLFEYVKDNKFERLKEPSAYDHSCKTLYPEQNSSQKIQRVVLRGYTYDQKITGYTIVDMGS